MNKEQKRLAKLSKLKTDSELAIFDHVNELEDTIEEKVSELKSEFKETVQEIKQSIPDLNTVLESVRGLDGRDGEDAIVDYDYILSQIPTPKDGETPEIDYKKIIDDVLVKIPKPKDGDTPKIDYSFIVEEVIKQIPTPENGRDGSPDMAEDIRNKLELLEGDERLDKKAIKGIEEIEAKFPEIERKINNAVIGAGNGVATTTNFFQDGSLIGRAKNINIVGGGTVSVKDDMAIINTEGGGDTGYVPYTGATQDVTLGSHRLIAGSSVDDGTKASIQGAGFNQTYTVTTPSKSLSLISGSYTAPQDYTVISYVLAEDGTTVGTFSTYDLISGVGDWAYPPTDLSLTVDESGGGYSPYQFVTEWVYSYVIDGLGNRIYNPTPVTQTTQGGPEFGFQVQGSFSAPRGSSGGVSYVVYNPDAGAYIDIGGSTTFTDSNDFSGWVIGDPTTDGYFYATSPQNISPFGVQIDIINPAGSTGTVHNVIYNQASNRYIDIGTATTYSDNGSGTGWTSGAFNPDHYTPFSLKIFGGSFHNGLFTDTLYLQDAINIASVQSPYNQDINIGNSIVFQSDIRGVRLGFGNYNSGNYGVVVGTASNYGDYSSVMGNGSSNGASGGSIFGASNTINGSGAINSTITGYQNTLASSYTTLSGYGNSAPTGEFHNLFGFANQGNSYADQGFGMNNIMNGRYDVSTGINNTINHDQVVALGMGITSTNNNQIYIGGAGISGRMSLLFDITTVSTLGGIDDGFGTPASGQDLNIVTGTGVNGGAQGNFTISSNNINLDANGFQSLATFNAGFTSPNPLYEASEQIGKDAHVTDAFGLAFGSQSYAGFAGLSMGTGAYSAGNYAIAIGTSANATNNNEVNISTMDSTYGTLNGSGGYTQLDIYNGVADFQGNSVKGVSIIKTGGTSSEFLKADGSVDSTTYVPNISGTTTATGAVTTTFTVTIGQTMANNTYKVVTEGNNVLSSAVHYVTNKTTTTFDVVYLTGLTGAVSFDWIVAP